MARGTKRPPSGVKTGASARARHDHSTGPEGEFDALVLRQEAGDLVDVLTLGSAGADWPEDGRTLLLGCARVLLLLDGDDAGEVAVARLSETFATARHVALPDGRDVTDYYLSGGDPRALVEPHVWQPPAPIVPDNPRCHCGGDVERYSPDGEPRCEQHSQKLTEDVTPQKVARATCSEPVSLPRQPATPLPPAPRAPCVGGCGQSVPEGGKCAPCAVKAIVKRYGPSPQPAPAAKRGAA